MKLKRHSRWMRQKCFFTKNKGYAFSLSISKDCTWYELVSRKKLQYLTHFVFGIHKQIIPKQKAICYAVYLFWFKFALIVLEMPPNDKDKT